MKKLFMLLAMGIVLSSTAVTAQTAVKTKVDGPNHKSKVKPTTTVGQKIHNTFSKNKKYSGVKAKGKNKNTNAKTKVEVTRKD